MSAHLHTIYNSRLMHTAGGYASNLQPEFVHHAPDIGVEAAADIGALDASDYLPGGTTVVETYRGFGIRIVGHQPIHRDFAAA